MQLLDGVNARSLCGTVRITSPRLVTMVDYGLQRKAFHCIRAKASINARDFLYASLSPSFPLASSASVSLEAISKPPPCPRL